MKSDISIKQRAVNSFIRMGVSLSCGQVWLLLLFCVGLIPARSMAQKNIYMLQGFKISADAVDSTSSFRVIRDHKDGQFGLRKEIYANPERFPLELEAKESSRDLNHEVHKRWERYMRTLSVTIVDIENFERVIETEAFFGSSEAGKLSSTDTLILVLKNKRKYSMTFELSMNISEKVILPRLTSSIEVIKDKRDTNSSFNLYSRGEALVQIAPKSQVKVSMPIVYSNNGRDSAQGREGVKSEELSLDYFLTGYFYDEKKKRLYKIVALNKKNKLQTS